MRAVAAPADPRAAMEALLDALVERGASDLHLASESVPALRLDGDMCRLDAYGPLSTQRLAEMLWSIAPPRNREEWEQCHDTDFAHETPAGRFRANVFADRKGIGAVFRVIPNEILTAEALGLPAAVVELCGLTKGLVLVTGPTGSGKTNTLYSALSRINTVDTNIMTAEDPVEFNLPGVNQVQMKDSIGLNFAAALRSFLRQDPNIILVGEIRDFETAEIAVKAALTGHLVLSTLHTNDAPSSIIRLLDLGIPSFLISSTIIGIIAQRLVRKICSNCKTERILSPKEIDHLRLEKGVYTVYEGEGCGECRGTGFRGRTGIFEVLEFTDGIKAALTDTVSLDTIYDTASRDGLINLQQVAIRKMLESVTTYEEIIAVTG